MKFFQALNALKEGKKVTHLSWPSGHYMFINSSGVLENENGKIYELSWFNGGFWEIYEEPEKALENPSMEDRIKALEKRIHNLEHHMCTLATNED